MNYIRVI